jgi:hypothetical protein
MLKFCHQTMIGFSRLFGLSVSSPIFMTILFLRLFAAAAASVPASRRCDPTPKQPYRGVVLAGRASEKKIGGTWFLWP